MSPAVAVDFQTMLASPFFAFTVEVLLKASVVLLFGSIMVRLVPRSTAAARHLVWSMTLTSALLIPLLTVALPAWNVELPTTPSARFTSPLPVGATPTTLTSTRLLPGTVTAARSGLTAAPTALPLASVEPMTLNLGLLLAVAWTLGALVFAARLAAGLLRGRRLIREGRELTLDGELRALLVESNIRRGVRIIASHNVAVPMTFGAWRPVLLVPRGFTTWSAGRKRLVLLHELAHIARLDWLAQIAGQLTMVAYWFHPLTWFALSRLKREAEDAADDRVLLAGERPSEYASHLLDIVRSLAPGRHAPMATVSMLGSSFERRVRAILDPDRPRATRSLQRAVLLGAALTLVGGVGLLAALEVHAARPDNQFSVKPVLAPGFGYSFSTSPSAPPVHLTAPLPPQLAGTTTTPDPPLPPKPFAVIAGHGGFERLHAWFGVDHDQRPDCAKGCDGGDWFQLGYALHHEKNWKEAAAAWEKAYEKDFNPATTSYNLACAYARLKDTKLAIGWLEKAIGNGFDVDDYLLSDSDLRSLHDDPQFQKLVEQNGGDRARQRALRAFERAERDREHADRFEQQSRYYQLGLELYEVSEYQRAIESWQKSIGLGQRTGAATYNIACAQALSGDKNAALESLQLAIERGYGDVESIRQDDDLDSLHGDARFEQALALARELELPNVGQSDRDRDFHRPSWRAAFERYEAFTRSHPKLGRGYYNLGYAALFAGEPARAVTAFQHAFELGYSKANTAYNLGCAYARTNHADRAFEWLEKSAELGSGSLGNLLIDPDLKSLRNDPRFRDLVKRHGQGPGGWFENFFGSWGFEQEEE